jgi:hypothetical protein
MSTASYNLIIKFMLKITTQISFVNIPIYFNTIKFVINLELNHSLLNLKFILRII